MTITPQGNGAATAALGTSPIEHALAAYNARNPNAKASDVVVPSLPEDEIEEIPDDLTGGVEAEAESVETEEQPEEVEGEAEAEETQAPDERKIILPDGEEVTVEEARKGYLRQRDYTQKTQRIAEDHRALVAEKSVWAERAQEMIKNLDTLQEKEPNWTQLASSGQYTAEELQKAQFYWQDRQRTLKEAREAVERTQREQYALQKRRFFDDLQSGQFNPEWKDQAKLKADLGKVFEYGSALGYPAEMIDSLTDPRIIAVFDKARRWDEANSKKPIVTKALSNKPAVAKPGSRAVASPKAEAARTLEEKFGKSKHIDDAVALFNAREASRHRTIRR